MKIAFAIGLACVLAGCSTSYGVNGFDGGFTDTRLRDNTFQVNFRGNGFTRPEEVREMAVLRAAELMEAAGYPYFTVPGENANVQNISINNPGTARTTGTVDSYTGAINAKTTYSGGSTTNIALPSITVIAVGYRAEPNTNAVIYETKTVIESLGPKYKK